MKKLVLVTAVAALLLSGSALADDVTLYNSDIGSLVLKEVAIDVGEDGKQAVLLDLVGTYNESEPQIVSLVFSVDVYQNGKQLAATYLDSTDSPYYELHNNQYTKLKNGASEEYFQIYLLNDDTSDLEIDVSEFFDWNSETVVSYYSFATGEATSDVPEAETEPDYKALYFELLEKYEALVGDSDA